MHILSDYTVERVRAALMQVPEGPALLVSLKSDQWDSVLKGSFAKKLALVGAYEADEVLARQGEHSDWGFVLLAGSVRVYEEPPAVTGESVNRSGRIGRPSFQEAELDRPDRLHRRVKGGGREGPPVSGSAPIGDHFLGWATTLWNQPHAVTLMAGDGGCTLLLLKRVVLRKLLEKAPALGPWNRARFWSRKVPHLLARNALFRSSGLSEDELAGTLREFLLEAAGREGAVELLRFDREEAHHFRDGCVVPDTNPAGPGSGASRAGLRVFDEREADGSLYFILNGMVRLEWRRKGSSGSVIVNQFGPHDFLGPACVGLGDYREIRVAAVSDANLIRVDGGMVKALQGKVPNVTTALEKDCRRHADRLEAVKGVRHLPPEGMTQETAAKLLLATDLLRIDMDLCVRCDECVAGCAAGHADIARFQRANPKLSFGRWEVALACVHCSDAPCQAVCPSAGAITFLSNGLVHIHHDLCTGCMNCEPACPFEVIVMHAPARPEDAPNLQQDSGIALKCDRCVTRELDPPCVTSCPYGAARRGAPEQLFPGLREWAVGGGPPGGAMTPRGG